MIYTIGETVLDIIFKTMNPIAAKAGGSALNTAVSLGNLQNKVSFISEIGRDEPGNFCKQFLLDNRVDITHMVTYASQQTSIALAFLNDHNDAQYQFYKNLPNQFRCSVPQFQQQDIVLFSSSFALCERVREQLLQIIVSAKLAGAYIIYDPNMRKQLKKKSVQEKYIFENFKLANTVRASDEDCLNIFGTSQTHVIYKTLQQYGVNTFICTKNSESVEIYTPYFYSNYSVPEINPISTIGAGDTFNAGIIHCINKYKKESGIDFSREFWDKTIPFAIACASQVCCSLENYLNTTSIETINSPF